VTQTARQSATTRFSPTATARTYATIYAEAIARQGAVGSPASLPQDHQER
jgi:hypothetical protein